MQQFNLVEEVNKKLNWQLKGNYNIKYFRNRKYSYLFIILINLYYTIINLIYIYSPKRFKDSTEAHSGKNPSGPFESFLKKDPLKNIDIRRDERPIPDPKNDYPYM